MNTDSLDGESRPVPDRCDDMAAHPRDGVVRQSLRCRAEERREQNGGGQQERACDHVAGHEEGDRARERSAGEREQRERRGDPEIRRGCGNLVHRDAPGFLGRDLLDGGVAGD